MKKYMIYIGIFIFIFILIVCMIPKENDNFELYFIQESQYLLNDGKTSLKIEYFTSDESFKLLEPDDVCFLTNENEDIKFITNVITDRSIHQEYYKNKLFYGREVNIELPKIDTSIKFDKLYFHFKYQGQKHKVFVGSLYIEYSNEISKNIIKSLEGIKHDNFPRLKQIIVELNDEYQIDEIVIGDTICSYYQVDKTLVIHFFDEPYVCHTAYLKIIICNEVYYVGNFKFFYNYELLNSGSIQKCIFIS